MKITEPYSPTARANARLTPPTRAGAKRLGKHHEKWQQQEHGQERDGDEDESDAHWTPFGRDRTCAIRGDKIETKRDDTAHDARLRRCLAWMRLMTRRTEKEASSMAAAIAVAWA